jgi:hypothetical protein
MAMPKARARTRRREAQRAAEKLARQRASAFELGSGGAPQRAIPVLAASVVDAHARSLPCPRCGAEQQLEEHLARVIGEVGLREARMVCKVCHGRISIWFRVGEMVN